MDDLDSALHWFVGIAIFAAFLKGLFWVLFFSGMARSFSSAAQQNPFLALFGIQPARVDPAVLEAQHRSRYAFVGLVIAVCCILAGAVLVIGGFGDGTVDFRIAGFEVNRATPGIFLMILGAYLVKVTAFPAPTGTRPGPDRSTSVKVAGVEFKIASPWLTAFVLVALIAVTLVVKSTGSDSGLHDAVQPLSPVVQQSAVEPPTVVAPRVSYEKAELLTATKTADNLESEARRNSDPSRLPPAFMGEALRAEEDAIAGFRSRDLYLDSRLEDLAIESYEIIPDGTQATVHVTETWQTTIYSLSTRTCLARILPRPVPQTAFLRRSNNVWMIAAIEQHGAAPQLVACE
jgi:hypothetical protein